jgi:hypothetical protein
MGEQHYLIRKEFGIEEVFFTSLEIDIDNSIIKLKNEDKCFEFIYYNIEEIVIDKTENVLNIAIKDINNKIKIISYCQGENVKFITSKPRRLLYILEKEFDEDSLFSYQIEDSNIYVYSNNDMGEIVELNNFINYHQKEIKE